MKEYHVDDEAGPGASGQDGGVSSRAGEHAGRGRFGGGLVKVSLNGKGAMARMSIDKSLMKPDDAKSSRTLSLPLITTRNKKSSRRWPRRCKSLTGGLPLPPGLKLF